MTLSVGIDHIPFNYKLRRAREAKGLSRKALATLVGIDNGRMGQYEALKAWPTEDRAIRIAIALERPIEEIFPEGFAEVVRANPAHKRTSVVDMEPLSLSSREPGCLQLVTKRSSTRPNPYCANR